MSSSMVSNATTKVHSLMFEQMRRYANLKSSKKKLKWNLKKRSEWRGHALGLQGIGGDGLGKDEIAVVLVLAVDSGTEKHTTAPGFL